MNIVKKKLKCVWKHLKSNDFIKNQINAYPYEVLKTNWCSWVVFVWDLINIFYWFEIGVWRGVASGVDIFGVLLCNYMISWWNVVEYGKLRVIWGCLECRGVIYIKLRWLEWCEWWVGMEKVWQLKMRRNEKWFMSLFQLKSSVLCFSLSLKELPMC